VELHNQRAGRRGTAGSAGGSGADLDSSGFDVDGISTATSSSTSYTASGRPPEPPPAAAPVNRSPEKVRRADNEENRAVLFGGSSDRSNDPRAGDLSAVGRPPVPAESVSGATAVLAEAREQLHIRGERLNQVADKSAKLADSSRQFAKMARELNEPSKSKFLWW